MPRITFLLNAISNYQLFECRLTRLGFAVVGSVLIFSPMAVGEDIPQWVSQNVAAAEERIAQVSGGQYTHPPINGSSTALVGWTVSTVSACRSIYLQPNSDIEGKDWQPGMQKWGTGIHKTKMGDRHTSIAILRPLPSS